MILCQILHHYGLRRFLCALDAARHHLLLPSSVGSALLLLLLFLPCPQQQMFDFEFLASLKNNLLDNSALSFLLVFLHPSSLLDGKCTLLVFFVLRFCAQPNILPALRWPSQRTIPPTTKDTRTTEMVSKNPSPRSTGAPRGYDSLLRHNSFCLLPLRFYLSTDYLHNSLDGSQVFEESKVRQKAQQTP